MSTAPTNGHVTPTSSVSDAFSALASALAPMIESKIAAKVDESTVNGLIDEKFGRYNAAFEDLIDSRIAKIPARQIEIRNVDTGNVVKLDAQHAKFDDLVFYVSQRDHVYLHGPAGSGKSTAAKNAATACGLRYGYIALNVGTFDSKLFGYQDANGTYHSTQFRDLFENGGLFCIDEMDNASGNLLTTINGALENGHCAFPDGLVAHHPDFVCVGTGNTTGRGANRNYSDRRPFDAAFADRFTFIEWSYDETLERDVALAINANSAKLVTKIQAMRAYCATNFPQVLVTPRATFKAVRYVKAGRSIDDVLEAVIFKGLESSQVNQIKSACL